MTTLSRWHQILSFVKVAASPLDMINLAILGFARGHTFNSTDWISRIGRLFLPTITIKTKRSSEIILDLNPSDLGHLISFEEIFVNNCYNLELIPFQPETVLDCGSHIGLFSLLVGFIYPDAEVIAFEPNPENVKYIRHHLTINSSKISLIKKAISVQDGECWFEANYSNTGSLISETIPTQNSYRVETIDLAKFLETISRSSLLLKLDIEGEEMRVVPAILHHLPQKCAIFFESHCGEEGWKELSHCLSAVNFQVQQLRSRLPYVDGFALRT